MADPTASSSSSHRCNEEHVAKPASAQTLQKLDALSVRDLLGATSMEESSMTAKSSASPQDTATEASQGRRLSSSPIWTKCDFEWEMTFYTIKDLRGYFRTHPHVGGSFQSLDEAYEAIEGYLTDQEDLTMGIGLSEVDKLIKFTRYFRDGTKRRLRPGQPIDKRRDENYQLVQAVLDKYNDYHNLFGDLAYEVKDVGEPSRWEEENYRMYLHMNFTAKTKGSNGSDTIDNLFFAEITYDVHGVELTVNCCCMVNPFDNGPCLGCGTTMKHPNDGNAYAGGRMHATNSSPFGPPSGYDEEDSDEEVERLRVLFGGAPATPGTS